MQVHEVVHDSTLKIVLDAVDNHLLADVHDLEKGQMVLVPVFIHGLVYFLVVSDAVAKVQSCLLRVLSFVVGTSCLNVSYVRHDQFLVVAFRLNVQHLDTSLGANIENPRSALFCRVGCVQECDNTVFVPKPFQHIGHSSLGGCSPLTLALYIGGVEEIGSRLRCSLAAVIADIEGLSGYGQPLEVSLGCSSDRR